jgi:hypothetical protein
VLTAPVLLGLLSAGSCYAGQSPHWTHQPALGLRLLPARDRMHGIVLNVLAPGKLQAWCMRLLSQLKIAGLAVKSAAVDAPEADGCCSAGLRIASTLCFRARRDLWSVHAGLQVGVQHKHKRHKRIAKQARCEKVDMLRSSRTVQAVCRIQATGSYRQWCCCAARSPLTDRRCHVLLLA